MNGLKKPSDILRYGGYGTLLCSVMCLGLTSCISESFSVVRSDSNQTGTFVVIPSSSFESETDFAARVEKALLRYGIKILERPTFKFLDSGTTRTDSSGSGASAYLGAGVSVGGGQSTSITRASGLIDIVSMYDETKADYIAVTYASPKGSSARIRVIRKSDRLVIASIDYSNAFSSEYDDKLFSALIANGVIPNKNQDILKCSTTKSPNLFGWDKSAY